MKVNIYYGGRGLLDDPTLYVLNKMEEVLQELRVTVERINIYEHKNEIATLPHHQTPACLLRQRGQKSTYKSSEDHTQ